MLNDFKKHIEDHFPHLLESTFLLACSGGMDSTVLADLCKRLQMDFVLAHCNFRLRGNASDGDEQLVRDLAEDHKIPFYVTHFDTIGYMNKNGLSLQVAARELRYAWFAEIMQENGIKTLVTAHHADDNLETFLINLSRGTGMDGLTGIPAKTDTIARPLLPFSRKQIMAYAKTQNIDWREDASNADSKYLRNKIRHGIVPLLKELHPTFEDNFKTTQAYLSDASIILKKHTAKLKSKLFTLDGAVIRIKIDQLSRLHPQKAYLHALFKEYGFTAWDDILSLFTAMSGKEVRSKTHRLVKDREVLLLSKITSENVVRYHIQENENQLKKPVRLSIEAVDAIGETGKSILYVDKKTLEYPLTLRNWQKGDYFYPLGMKGKKKLSKFFKDEKIDVISKEKQWLLCSDYAIVWVVGKRADERFKVNHNTTDILKFKLNL